MVTVATIVDEVRANVIDLPQAVTSRVQTFVERAHRQIQEEHNFKAMESLLTAPTTAGDPELGAIPVGRFKDYHGDPFWTDDLGYTGFLKVTHSEDEVRRRFGQDVVRDIGRPKVLLHRRPEAVGDDISLHHWRVFPIPDGLAQTSDGEYPIRVPYWSYLAVPTTSDWFTDNATEFLVEAATARAFRMNWDEARATYWYTQAYGDLWLARGIIGGSILRAINRDKRFMASSTDTIAPYSGAEVAGLRL